MVRNVSLTRLQRPACIGFGDDSSSIRQMRKAAVSTLSVAAGSAGSQRGWATLAAQVSMFCRPPMLRASSPAFGPPNVGPGTIADPLAMPQPRRSFTAPAEAARYPHPYQPGPCQPSKVPAMPVSVANELRLIDHGQAFDHRIRFRRNQRWRRRLLIGSSRYLNNTNGISRALSLRRWRSVRVFSQNEAQSAEDLREAIRKSDARTS
jgi:hypothetical protein